MSGLTPLESSLFSEFELQFLEQIEELPPRASSAPLIDSQGTDTPRALCLPPYRQSSEPAGVTGVDIPKLVFDALQRFEDVSPELPRVPTSRSPSPEQITHLHRLILNPDVSPREKLQQVIASSLGSIKEIGQLIAGSSDEIDGTQSKEVFDTCMLYITAKFPKLPLEIFTECTRADLISEIPTRQAKYVTFAREKTVSSTLGRIFTADFQTGVLKNLCKQIEKKTPLKASTDPKVFKKFAEKVLQKLYQIEIPQNFRLLISQRRSLIIERLQEVGFTHDEATQKSRILVCELLFLRIINPAIIQSTASDEKRSALIKVSRFLQMLANQETTGKIDPISQVSNELFDKYLSKHLAFIDRISLDS